MVIVDVVSSMSVRVLGIIIPKVTGVVRAWCLHVPVHMGT